MQHFDEIYLRNEFVERAVTAGGFSMNDIRGVFARSIEQRVRLIPVTARTIFESCSLTVLNSCIILICVDCELIGRGASFTLPTYYRNTWNRLLCCKIFALRYQ